MEIKYKLMNTGIYRGLYKIDCPSIPNYPKLFMPVDNNSFLASHIKIYFSKLKS